jgi:hypothetical protein
VATQHTNLLVTRIREIRVLDREKARRELGRKEETFWDQCVALRGEEGARQSVEWQKTMIAVLDSGDFCRPFSALEARR